MTAWWIAIAVFGVALVAEAIHAQRTVQLAGLVFGRWRRATALARVAPFIKAAAMAAFAWGAATLLVIEPKRSASAINESVTVDPMSLKRVLILLDVSPSMQLADAGGSPEGVSAGRPLKMTRGKRAGEVLMNALSRVSFDKARVTVTAFYTGVKPVVIDTVDPNVVKNIVDGLPLDQAFEDGETDLMDGIKGAFELARDWRPGSATLLLLTDGDTAPMAALPPVPASIGRVVIAGVGDSAQGTFIDGHESRQEPGNLEELALRLNGTYQNADTRFLPSDLLEDMSGEMTMESKERTGSREAALAAVGGGIALMALLPIMLAWFGVKEHRPANKTDVPSVRNQVAMTSEPPLAGPVKGGHATRAPVSV